MSSAMVIKSSNISKEFFNLDKLSRLGYFILDFFLWLCIDIKSAMNIFKILQNTNY